MEALRCYLLDPDAGYTDKSAGRAFNLIDVVFINGDAAVLPWSEKNREVRKNYLRIFQDLYVDKNVHESQKTVFLYSRSYANSSIFMRY